MNNESQHNIFHKLDYDDLFFAVAPNRWSGTYGSRVIYGSFDEPIGLANKL